MPRRPHQFRFQVFHAWLVDHYPPGKVADVGGGKGLLSFLLNQSGFNSTVIDPVWQPLEWKYKDLQTGKRVKLSTSQMNSVPHLQSAFSIDFAPDFDLLVGLHAHGSNILLLQAAAKFSKPFAILPCCVIDEPIIKQSGINWFTSLVDYAASLSLNPQVATLNFVGQSQVIYTHS